MKFCSEDGKARDQCVNAGGTRGSLEKRANNRKKRTEKIAGLSANEAMRESERIDVREYRAEKTAMCSKSVTKEMVTTSGVEWGGQSRCMMVVMIVIVMCEGVESSRQIR